MLENGILVLTDPGFLPYNSSEALTFSKYCPNLSLINVESERSWKLWGEYPNVLRHYNENWKDSYSNSTRHSTGLRDPTLF